VAGATIPAALGAESAINASEHAEYLTYGYNMVKNAASFTQSWDQALSPAAAPAGARPDPASVSPVSPVFAEYRRHNADVRGELTRLLGEVARVYPGAVVRGAVTGSAGTPRCAGRYMMRQ